MIGLQPNASLRPTVNKSVGFFPWEKGNHSHSHERSVPLLIHIPKLESYRRSHRYSHFPGHLYSKPQPQPGADVSGERGSNVR